MNFIIQVLFLLLPRIHGQGVGFPTPAPSPAPTETAGPSPTPFGSPTDVFPSPFPSDSPKPSSSPSQAPTITPYPIPKPTFGVPTASPLPTSPTGMPTPPPLVDSCPVVGTIEKCDPIAVNETWSVPQRALAIFYASTLGCHWNNATRWLSSDNECTWFGIKCNEQTGKVTDIDLPWNNLQCQIASELANLDALNVLELGLNKLTGTIPPELEQLDFYSLHLHFNQLTGTIPQNLIVNSGLLLQDNFFTGQIPSGIGALDLDVLSLSSNCLTGSIPFDRGDDVGSTRVQRYHSNELIGPMKICSSTDRPDRTTELTADCWEVECPCCTKCYPDPSPFPCDDPVLYASSGWYSEFPLSSPFYAKGLYVPIGFDGGFQYNNPSLPTGIHGLVIDPATSRTFIQQSNPLNQIFEIDLKTGKEIPGTRFSTETDTVDRFFGMEFIDGILYGAGYESSQGGALGNSELYVIDPDNKSLTSIGPTGVHPITGLAWTGTHLYASSGILESPNRLFTVDVTTGAATIICAEIGIKIGSLVYDWSVSKLYFGVSAGQMYEIKPDTCEYEKVYSFGVFPVYGLAFACYNVLDVNNCKIVPSFPSQSPTETPGPSPTPSGSPTDVFPSPFPSDSPKPSSSPSQAPTITPYPIPKPTFGVPTAPPLPTSPTGMPTESPMPTHSPFSLPTSPTGVPTDPPSSLPTNPTRSPSASPLPTSLTGMPTESPMPTHSPSSLPTPITFVPCFSGFTMAELENGIHMQMKDLRLGDRVLVSKGKYEAIYSFGHFGTEGVKTEFLQLHTTTSRGLEITAEHLVVLEGSGTVPASSIKVGDEVVTASGESDIVVSINKVVRMGIFAPFTPSGTIVANGIQVSCFATLQGESGRVSLGGYEIPLTYHQLGLIFEAPHRLLCHVWLDACHRETYNTEGMSHWVALPMRGFIWLLKQNVMVSGVIFFAWFALFLAFNVLEMVLTGTLLPYLLVVVMVMALSMAKIRNSYFVSYGQAARVKQD